MPRDQNAVVVDRASLEAEVARIVAAARAQNRPIRVLGSIGVALHCPDAQALLPSFARTYADIDFAAYRRDSRAISAILVEMGYLEDREVFIVSEGRRAMFDSPVRQFHLDLFFDRLEFSHVIPLAGRLDRDSPTIPLAELMLSKLQIARINEKDVVDTILLLLDHRLGSGDDDTIDVDRIAGLCAAEWGLWRTLTMNLEKVATLAAGYPQLADGQRERVLVGVSTLKAAIDLVPKPLAWRLRARVGDRSRWWTEVDEVR